MLDAHPPCQFRLADTKPFPQFTDSHVFTSSLKNGNTCAMVVMKNYICQVIFMKLNISCVRDLLLLLEEKPFYTVNEHGFIESQIVLLDDICSELPNYSSSDIYYTLSLLDDAGFLSLITQWGDDSLIFCAVESMTYAGHELLENIRDDGRWKAVTIGLAAVRNYSLSAISSLAEAITAGAISAYLGRGQ